jgi:hypothetical protein
MNNKPILSETGSRLGPLPGALLVPCPKCKQGDGAWCIDPTGPGGFAIALHLERLAAMEIAFR